MGKYQRKAQARLKRRQEAWEANKDRKSRGGHEMHKPGSLKGRK